MKSAFSGWQDFFAMGGYAFYVWLAVAFTLAPLAVLVLHTWWQRRSLILEVRRQHAREQRVQAARQRATAEEK
ncbi:heme exporter protein CcmD [Entomohabitans teleogrylli]|uniref:heme exporter protein CcmD n=1 Tax=Entomohabitans teleogrylli TaxID=1384589 RepID=UPI00073D4864|nr:heme exporter protein CcmD [Entomohabitans teleogrylli]